MNKILVKLVVEPKSNDETHVEETIEITWANSTTVDTVYLQIFNRYNHKIIHAFLTHEIDVPYVFHVEQPSHYQVYAYGLKQCNKTSAPYYIIENAASMELESLHVEGKDMGHLRLVPEFKYEPMADSDQSSYGIEVDVNARDYTKYVFKGFQQQSFYIVFLHDLYFGKLYLQKIMNDNVKVTPMPFGLKPACEFSFQCFQVEKRNESSFLGNSHSTVCKFRTSMTVIQVHELLYKARRFMRFQRNYHLLTHFYRDQSYSYFTDVMENKKGVLKKHPKTYGGDQFSTLNGKLCGLFFSAFVDPKTDLPPTESFFGPLRLYVPIYLLLNNTKNLYFSDFYCHYKRHKVQLVITENGSNSDVFCSRRLVKLHPFCNDFWMLSNSRELYVTAAVAVEIFYTEDVHIPSWWREHDTNMYFEETDVIGNAPTKTGIPKRIDCTQCNLTHVVRARAK